MENDTVLLDSESMPPPAFLMHPSSDAEMARERESLYDEAMSLSLRMSVTHFTSQIAEDELKNFIRFLSSEEHTPAQKLHLKLDRIKRTLGSISAAVEAHASPRLRSSTPPGNRQPGPSSIYVNHQQLSTPAVFQQHAAGRRTSSSPEFIPGHQTEPHSEAVAGHNARKRRGSPQDTDGSDGQTARKRRRESAGDEHSSREAHNFFERWRLQRMVQEGHGPANSNRNGGWQWDDLVESFRTEFGTSKGCAEDPKWYSSNKGIKSIGQCWREARDIRRAC